MSTTAKAAPTAATTAAPVGLPSFSLAELAISSTFGRPGTLFDTSQKLREEARTRENVRNVDEEIHLRSVAAQKSQEHLIGKDRRDATRTPEAHQKASEGLSAHQLTAAFVPIRA